MNKIFLPFFALLFVSATSFADNLIIENKTSYPAKNQESKIVIQWADSAKQVQEYNEEILMGRTLNPTKLQEFKGGKVTLTIPPHAEYFRILVWTNGKSEPDLLTNWVDVVPNKTYTLNSDHLVPAVLSVGMGC